MRPAQSDQMPTLVLAPTRPPSGPARSHGPFRWMRTLRWRLTLIYAGTLLLLLLALGVVLNGVIGRVLYSEDQVRLSTEARAAVELGQTNFEKLINGQGTACAGALSYQQAFQDAITTPLTTAHPAIPAAYLVDLNGAVLAPESGAVPVGDAAPYLDLRHLAQVRQKVFAARPLSGTGPVAGASTVYDTVDANGQRIGVILIAERYHTVSHCFRPDNAATGIVEVVVTYGAVRVALASVQLLLLVALLAALIAGVLASGPLISRALRPLTRMTATARRIAEGDLSQRIRLPHGGDEIGQLADTFDEMIARIDYAFAAQHASEERMRLFIADASHELRTPLTSIRGYLDVLLRGAKDDPATADQVLQATRREAERMSRLVNDLLTLARIDAGRPLDVQPVDLVALTGEAVDQARILAGEREVTMRTDGTGHLIVSADADRLKQVLLILLDNALKYGRQDLSGWVRVQVGRSPRGAYVSVADNGGGIAPEDLPHIFDRFYRAQRAAQRRMTDAHAQARRSGVWAAAPGNAHQASQRPLPREGSGLGLAIAQAITQAHGGVLSVQSQPGAGTTFTVELSQSAATQGR
jgi:two-component system, OmpR family, sensor kinase